MLREVCKSKSFIYENQKIMKILVRNNVNNENYNKNYHIKYNVRDYQVTSMEPLDNDKRITRKYIIGMTRE